MKRLIYSTYEAKSRFSEILRKVRQGESVFISYRGVEVAEIRPTEVDENMESKLEKLERRGVISRARRSREEVARALRPIARRPGSLKRFLESRD